MTLEQADLLFILVFAIGIIGLFGLGYLCGVRR